MKFDLIGKTTKQMGCVTYGGGMNHRSFIEEAKAKGQCVMLKDGYAEIHNPGRARVIRVKKEKK